MHKLLVKWSKITALYFCFLGQSWDWKVRLGQTDVIKINRGIPVFSFLFSRNSCYSLVISDEYMYDAISADFWGYFSPNGAREDLSLLLYSTRMKPVMLSQSEKKICSIHLHFDMLHLCIYTVCALALEGSPRKVLSESTRKTPMSLVGALLKRWYNQENTMTKLHGWLLLLLLVDMRIEVKVTESQS